MASTQLRARATTMLDHMIDAREIGAKSSIYSAWRDDFDMWRMAANDMAAIERARLREINKRELAKLRAWKASR